MGCCKSAQYGCCIAIDDDESIILNKPTGKEIRHGPGWNFFPCWYDVNVIKSIPLQRNEYLVVKHIINDRKSKAHATNTSNKEEGIEFINADAASEDAKLMEIIHGPQIYRIRNPYDQISDHTVNRGIKQMLNLSSTQYLIVTNKFNGEKKVERGPKLYCPRPSDDISDIRNMYNLSSTEYIIVTDESSGEKNTVPGPQLFCPKAYDKISVVYSYIVLNHTNYCRIIDSRTGVMRMEEGPKTFALGPYESLIKLDNQTIFDIINIDNENAVLVKNLDTGFDELITKPQKFIPSFTQKFLEIRKLIKLAPYENMVLIDKDGQHILKNGLKDKSFFIYPYQQVYTQEWSNDLNKNHKSINKVDRFDTRNQYMDYEFLVRTADNVEIILDVSIFWQITDLYKLVLVTMDPPEDICNHTRSQILSEVSKYNMKEFMELPNNMLIDSVNKDDNFYNSRGVNVIRVEVLQKRCKDAEIQKIFKQIIDEKTNRIKNNEKQEASNEIRLRDLTGQIDAEKLFGTLLKIKKENERQENQADGIAEGSKIQNFINNLGDDIPLEKKLQIYFDIQNTKRLELLASNKTSMYLTPKEVDTKVVNVNTMYSTNDVVQQKDLNRINIEV
ncbi:unnamed protein product [Didymodactylos carnosus]|uniref:Band 7 domain-containing protein n=1 Tax=Didymodactylos carnosus TaxID=1234261 RepID=A0A813PUE8_9BILA|nr:unnamed protein product [Didymodactylos carnosus]CAF0839357.1 unnamed protein product [Didymodactylos carnosus]CAF3538583.1 unnamed protein product [Didymodactylos carnosus]CAF3624205.1 unnamed protein product [Didymodactylos carnosus]